MQESHLSAVRSDPQHKCGAVETRARRGAALHCFRFKGKGRKTQRYCDAVGDQKGRGEGGEAKALKVIRKGPGGKEILRVKYFCSEIHASKESRGKVIPEERKKEKTRRSSARFSVGGEICAVADLRGTLPSKERLYWRGKCLRKRLNIEEAKGILSRGTCSQKVFRKGKGVKGIFFHRVVIFVPSRREKEGCWGLNRKIWEKKKRGLGLLAFLEVGVEILEEDNPSSSKMSPLVKWARRCNLKKPDGVFESSLFPGASTLIKKTPRKRSGPPWGRVKVHADLP